MCDAIQDLISVINSTLEHNCTSLSNCEGLLCELEAYGEVYFFEVLYLACGDQPMVEWVLENYQMRTISVEILDQGAIVPHPFFVAGTDLVIDWEVIFSQYSVEVQVKRCDYTIPHLKLLFLVL